MSIFVRLTHVKMSKEKSPLIQIWKFRTFFFQSCSIRHGKKEIPMLFLVLVHGFCVQSKDSVAIVKHKTLIMSQLNVVGE